ncbi:MAG: CvpA family protein, partial [Candidatus Limnocylindria bacterium]
MTGLNPIDLLLAAALVLAAVSGVRAGFVATLYGLFSWVVAVVGALLLHAPFGAALAAATGIPGPVARIVAFLGVLLVLELALGLLG